ncbi:terminase large subunit domain-containing protein [Ottowia sp.]|uniref:terminase large subunit domain-containing protein n=1 Tax=Ottowia sp. TaxID=1898956 RepID=UPI003A889D16
MPSNKTPAARKRATTKRPGRAPAKRPPGVPKALPVRADSAAQVVALASDAVPAGGWPDGFGLAPAPQVQDLRRQARSMFWGGFRIAAIARALDIKRTTLHGWAKAEGWSKAKPVDKVVGSLEVRLAYLIGLPAKEGQHLKEIDLLARQMARFVVPAFDGAVARPLGADGSPLVPDHVGRLPALGSDEHPDGRKVRRKRPTAKAPKNHFDPEHVQELQAAYTDLLYSHQQLWQKHIGERVRLILKSRQIGATWYFAREALIDLLTTARSQVFLSASRAQADLFRSHQRGFVREVLDMDLEGDPIVFSNGAREFFLGRNVATAQGYAGNLYFDEIYWVPNFGVMESTAGAIATHKHFRKTYFSTPSTVTADAYDLWTGERFNTGRSKAEQVAIDLSSKRLIKGHRGGDGVWRNLMSAEQAVLMGFDRIDLEQLRRENAPAAYRNLYMCEFVDDQTAVFPYEWLKGCGVDSWDAWAADWQPFAPRPFGYRGVWVGYDPSGGNPDGDACGLVVVAPPDAPGGAFRVLEYHRLHGDDYEAQARFIKQITERYNVLKMGIDVTGLGQGVFQLVQKFFPVATPIHYSPEVKAQLVMGAQNVMRRERLQWDAGAADLVQSFMAIKHGSTRGGQLTYVSGRRKKTGHADLAWALMNALSFEPLTGAGPTANVVEVF